MADDGPRISVAAGITVGLVASFVQSFGLTIQRKSHLQNDALPPSSRKSDWHRPLWLIGFTVYFTSNILGSIFQIGALPLVILGPLGAVSLLWNAVLARFLLGDLFSYHLVIGTIFIAGGAVLIGFFGVVAEPAHPLEYLLKLYSRPAFLIEFILLCAAVAGVCLAAHISEWRLEKKLREALLERFEGDGGTKEDHAEHGLANGMARRKRRASLGRTGRPRAISLPTPQVARPSPTAPALSASASLGSGLPEITPPPRSDPSPVVVAPTAGVPTLVVPEKPSVSPIETSAIARIRLVLGSAYGAASGTLSGVCLLFAKTGVELLILTVVGSKNEFIYWQTWVIVGALLLAAVLQLWYLNKALRLVGPTLICPLAFCFYNLSSILNGLVYYDQVRLLSALQIGMVVLGTAVLLAGVWIVSIRNGRVDQADGSGQTTPLAVEAEAATETTPLLHDSIGRVSLSDEPQDLADAESGAATRHVSWLDNDEEDEETDEEEHARTRASEFKRTVEQVYRMFVDDENQAVRGLSIGLGAASPGFAIRPSGRRDSAHHRTMSGSSPFDRGRRSSRSSTHPIPDLSDSLPTLPPSSPPSSPEVAKAPLTPGGQQRRPTSGERTFSAPGPRSALSDDLESSSSAGPSPSSPKSPPRRRPSRRERARKPRLSLSGDPYVGPAADGWAIYDEPRTPLVHERRDEESWLVRVSSPDDSPPLGPEEEEGTERDVGMVRASEAGRFDWRRLLGRGRRKGKAAAS